ncbi:hypothetical protein Indivirus_2_101 [Indivirus ILV1]|uniref:Uncharacterized protein n=1 Tax=Indivirus ILV1 TaxID=1977633 RepID=A0A1V0SDE1_9VIRU|nr:hypothetical protein Indivirus_2_101 [Indivirus ILV1]
MKKYKTLIIFDWDDTLFPTSWVVDNNIDLSDKDIQNKFIIYFSQLDVLLYNLLTTCLKYGTVFVVTNATIKWIQTAASVLPHTHNILYDGINVISARDTYQNEYPDQMNIWKKLTFQDLISNNFDKHKHQHVVSIGDAEHEFNALTDLYNESSITKHRLLKTIRLIRAPSFNALIDELDVLNSCIVRILTNHDHMDLKFKDKKNKL